MSHYLIKLYPLCGWKNPILVFVIPAVGFVIAICLRGSSTGASPASKTRSFPPVGTGWQEPDRRVVTKSGGARGKIKSLVFGYKIFSIGMQLRHPCRKYLRVACTMVRMVRLPFWMCMSLLNSKCYFIVTESFVLAGKYKCSALTLVEFLSLAPWGSHYSIGCSRR